MAYYNRGRSWDKKADHDKAIFDYTKALEINPSNGKAYYCRGANWDKKGDYGRAISDYTKALENNLRHAHIFKKRGSAWYKKGNHNQAIADYTKVIEIKPQHAGGYNSLAWLLATCLDEKYRNGIKAVELAKKAVEIKNAAYTLNTLAAAYAEAGKFEDAIGTLGKAIILLKDTGKTEALPEYLEHLKSYKAHKPWRDK